MRSHQLLPLVVLLLAACGGEFPEPGPAAPEVAESRSALCSCSFVFHYQAPVEVTLCFPLKGGGQSCTQSTQQHLVVCQNQCIACGTMTCTDMVTGANVVRPDEQYLVASHWFPCNSRNVCH